MTFRIKHIIWDWNGTLFDDVDLCVENINWLLEKYNYQRISKSRYKEIFTFPVIEYYRRAGFDLEKLDFAKIGKEWMDRYEQKKYQAKLADGAEEIVQYFHNRGLEQSILSAYSEHTLFEIVERFGLKKFFKNIVGLDNIYAESKIDLGKKLLNKIDAKPDEILLIGDTVHDFEVSRELGCRCILLSSGHQSKIELEKCGVEVINNLKDLKKFQFEILSSEIKDY
ncbi:MAG: HAD family hydrolase [Ignavibacteria bacterium]|jgi:phosphoglycolate phosphatase|nr:HAD family hydrolase [Ignavibacteria bacterium]MDH7528251.1 HAD family hydrolase [Ignavibacteria bacterium]